MAAPPLPPPLPPLTPEQAAETNLPRIMGVTATVHILALIFFGVRMYTRFILVKAPKLDDAFMMLAVSGAFASGMCMFIVQAPKGLGRHRQTILEDDFLDFRRYGWVYSVVCAVLSFSLLKISIALSLLRMSKVRWYVWTLYGLIAFIVSYTIVALCSFFFHCRPMQGSFNPSVPSKCYDIKLFVAFSIMNTSFNIFSDLVCAILPIPIIWTLNMKLKTRIYLIAVLSLGYITVAFGGVKAYFQLAPRDPDAQFEQNIQFWGFLQINLGIVVACAPTLRPLLGKALKLSSRDKYYGSYYGGRGGTRSGGTGLGGVQRSVKSRTDVLDDEDFEMHEHIVTSKTGQVTTTVRGGMTTIYDKNSDRSGSEEMILQETEPNGILKTTQINVQ